MPRVRVAVTGDEWCNRAEVIEGIRANAGAEELILEVNTEGPSLYALGIIDAVMPELAAAGIDIQNVFVDQWHNPVEQIPFRRYRDVGLSHFFWMSDRYRFTQLDPVPQDYVFGLFLGRLTAARSVILWQTCQEFATDTLVSVMRNSYRVNTYDAEIQDWLDVAQQAALKEWLALNPIASLTNHEIRDQYRPEHNTNADLARHYNRFAIEIACETYCAGDAFFPTEKTIRPIALGKPFLLYGPRHFLKYLRDLGFRTWHDVWDESYDALAGSERWQAMQATMKQIIKDKLFDDSQTDKLCKMNQQCLAQLITKHEPL